MILNSTHRNALISPARSISGKVELYEGSTLLNTFTHTDALSSITVSRAGGTKFFGFGVGQEVEVKLVDKERVINIEKNQILKISFVTNKSTVSPTPKFYISEVKRNENTNEITIKAYDAISLTKGHTVEELNLQPPYTILNVITKITQLLGISYGLDVTTREAFNISYPEGGNFEGTESLRDVLNWAAEATQTIYYVSNSNTLTFKHLDIAGEPVLTIRKADYFTLESKTNRTLARITNTTELEDSVFIDAPGVTGENQFVRDNPFWELRNDIADLLERAIGIVGGLTLNQFNCKWRGNYLLQPGDKIAIVTKDDSTVTSYLLNDKYVYNGGLSADTQWEYGDNEGETSTNPNTLGEALKQTFARVDKVNREIELLASNVEELPEEIASLKLTTESITQSVSKLNQEVNEVTGEMDTLNQKVESVVTAEDVQIAVKEQLASGVDSVTTSTGFTFNKDGLTISKSGTEMETQITEDGMTIYRADTPVLVTNHTGVEATNLHATTFLTVGGLNRFEEYIDVDNQVRIGAFWLLG